MQLLVLLFWERDKESHSSPARCHQVSTQKNPRFNQQHPTTQKALRGSSPTNIGITAVTGKGEKSDKAYFYKLQL